MEPILVGKSNLMQMLLVILRDFPLYMWVGVIRYEKMGEVQWK